MSLSISIRNHQSRHRIDAAALKRLARRLGVQARGFAAGAAPWREVAVHLLDDAGIAPFNAAIMRHAGATDVITQRYETCPGEPDGLVGELFVNVERAAASAPRRAGWSADRELALYLAHGFDHLAGADDATPAERGRMRRRELRWLRALPAEALFKHGR